MLYTDLQIELWGKFLFFNGRTLFVRRISKKSSWAQKSDTRTTVSFLLFSWGRVQTKPLWVVIWVKFCIEADKLSGIFVIEASRWPFSPFRSRTYFNTLEETWILSLPISPFIEHVPIEAPSYVSALQW